MGGGCLPAPSFTCERSGGERWSAAPCTGADSKAKKMLTQEAHD